MEREEGSEPPLKRRRASRAGQAKRFECQQLGCGKRYSRAEHLHRHELNHNPKEIYRCEVPDCGHTFVRPDLFARHKARHDDPTASTPADTRHAGSDIESWADQSVCHGSATKSNSSRPAYVSTAASTSRNSYAEPGNSVTDWTIPPQETLLTPDTSTISAGLSLSVSLGNPGGQANALEEQRWVAADPSSTQTNDNFAAWLFESPGSQYSEFNLTNLPFLDFGLEYSPKDIWNFEDHGSNADHPGPGSHPVTPNLGIETATANPYEKRLSDQRRADIIALLAHFCRKESEKNAIWRATPDHLLYSPDGLTFPNLTTDVLDNLLANYWLSGKQLPIIHEPTFSTREANTLLLLTMVAMGSYDLVRSRPKGSLGEYNELTLLIMTHLRWELFTDPDAQPPVQLWVAQSLLLLEYYEKQCSTRKLHERAHIHHASTLTLLRRGSPLVGRSESESPISGTPTRPGSPTQRDQQDKKPGSADSWWITWVRNESFNRVVFTAFQMDIMHAVIYGHSADMAPYEIRLPLPCDDSLWDAKSADEVQRLDANLLMYGIKPLQFLDGLKRCLHAHEVQTHAPARMLLMAGLLSVGWHISRREKHLQFLESVPSIREQGRWRTLLLHAFGYWRTSFDEAVGSRQSSLVASKQQEMNSAKSAVLFHLAHMTLHADIIDCQIFAGTKRLLGRRVAKKDYLNVVQRMRSWICTPVARHAVLHAFKLLHETLVKPSLPKKSAQTSVPLQPPTTITYKCRTDPVIFRPWATFLAALIVWAYQHASSLHITSSSSQARHFGGQDDHALCSRYLTVCAAIEDPSHLLPNLSMPGCAAVLAVLSQKFADVEPELLQEASKRLQECRNMLATGHVGWPSAWGNDRPRTRIPGFLSFDSYLP